MCLWRAQTSSKQTLRTRLLTNTNTCQLLLAHARPRPRTHTHTRISGTVHLQKNAFAFSFLILFVEYVIKIWLKLIECAKHQSSSSRSLLVLSGHFCSMLYTECVESRNQSNRFFQVLVLVWCSFALEDLLTMSFLLPLLLLYALLLFTLLVGHLRGLNT